VKFLSCNKRGSMGAEVVEGVADGAVRKEVVHIKLIQTPSGTSDNDLPLAAVEIISSFN
jgi:hypothetical protein